MGNFFNTLLTSVSQPGNVSKFEQFLAILDKTMERPTSYGSYHLLCLGIVLLLSLFFVAIGKHMNNKSVNGVLKFTAITLLLFELYKQINFSYDVSEDTWGYQWYAFPFQFCSTPMYVMLLAGCLKEGKLKDCLCSFLGTFGLFAGIAVMLYPGDVFIRTIGINIQTMVHHGMMVVIGVMMYATGKAKLSHSTIFKGLPIFVCLVGMAISMNVLYHNYGPADQTFNMFYISPYFSCTLPVLSTIYPLVPYPVFLCIYVFGFTLAGYIMSLFAMLFGKRKKQTNTDEWEAEMFDTNNAENF